ncbi:hypothetical protein [Corynebacterium epidermidicanis]|uniref:Uncharacterized protein n=1 Tax=Corynebacterium epidermidicanis TaxID=1050174 RepID=A0A0G3GVW8_9CORY|nr:hypothetical protein [Corynebacterium epidermidicanis]AKK03022.1 hypothetical protein CEPID_05790 [Corynebacterium epidermidicanis]
MPHKGIFSRALLSAAVVGTLAVGAAPAVGAAEAPTQAAAEASNLYTNQTVAPGHSVTLVPNTPLDFTDIADVSQSGIPEGWHVTINEDNGAVVVSPAPNAKKGDAVTLKIKIVDIDGRVTWHQPTVTASEDGTADSALPPADPDGPKVTYQDAMVEPGNSVTVAP